MVIVVQNIPPRMGPLRVRSVFEKFGDVRSIQLLVDPLTRGRMAYLDMPDENQALAAIQNLDGHTVNGAILKVSRQVPRPEIETHNIFNRGGSRGGFEMGARGGGARGYRGGSRGSGF